MSFVIYTRLAKQSQKCSLLLFRCFCYVSQLCSDSLIGSDQICIYSIYLHLLQTMSERKWDTFCWKCHRPSYDEVKCSKCDLSFHKNCITDQNRSKPGWLCPECKLLAETGGKRYIAIQFRLRNKIKRKHFRLILQKCESQQSGWIAKTLCWTCQTKSSELFSIFPNKYLQSDCNLYLLIAVWPFRRSRWIFSQPKAGQSDYIWTDSG